MWMVYGVMQLRCKGHIHCHGFHFGAVSAKDRRSPRITFGTGFFSDDPPMAEQPFMQIALAEANAAAAAGEVPVGAVIVRAGAVVACARNRTLADRDPTAHAEMLAIRATARALGSERLTDCDLYVTLEPCAMCAAAIAFARIRRLYYGAADPKGGAVDNGVRFFASPTCHHRPDVYAGIGESEAAALLKAFFRARR
jgi:tRNA(adenine34) deaminase